MSLVRSETEGGVCTVTLDDHPRRNALSDQLVEELTAVLDRAEADDETRVIVLTNAGSTFCAGADLAADRSGRPPAAIEDPSLLYGRFARASKPYVGRIAGHCMGGGMGLAAAMDISIVDQEARFGFTEVRLGVAPAVISVVCLPKLRPADARDVFLRGRRFTGTEAAAMGLVNQAVPAARLDDAVDEIVQDLLAAGPGALAAAKQLLGQVPAMPEADAFAWTAELSEQLFAGTEAQEGIAAFRARRRATFDRSR